MYTTSTMLDTIAASNPYLAYPLVFILMLSNGLLNFPSSQILYVFCGYLTTIGTKKILFFAIFGALGNTVGNIFLYELVRYRGAEYFNRKMNLPEEKKMILKDFILKHGGLYIFLAKLIPTVKVFVPLVAGFAKVNRLVTYLAFLISSFIWALMFLSVGVFFGTDSSIAKWYSLSALVFGLLLYFYAYKKYPTLFKMSL